MLYADTYAFSAVFNDPMTIHAVLGPMVERLVLPPERVARLILVLLNGLVVELAWSPGEEARKRLHQTFDDARTLLVRSLFASLS